MKLQQITENSTYKIYVDMDGVLVDFVDGANRVFKKLELGSYDESKYARDKQYKSQCWQAINRYQKENGNIFWKTLPKMPDADELLDFLQDYSYEILTATGRQNTDAGNQKKNWVKQHIGNKVKVNVVTSAKDKGQYAKSNYILVDDRKEAIDPWIAAGGIGVLHKSAEDTIKQLKKLGL